MSIDLDSPRVKRLILWPVLLLFNSLGLLLVKLCRKRLRQPGIVEL